MKRREFITLLGGTAAAWPPAARAQQPAMPVIGFLQQGSPEPNVHVVDAFRRGLQETGFIKDRNVMFEFRWANGEYNRLPALANDLVRRQPAVIAAALLPAAQAAKAASATIPIVFISGSDPIEAGLVTSLNRPAENVTGVSLFAVPLIAKRLELLHELVPGTTAVAVLINPANPNAESNMRDITAAGHSTGLHIEFIKASGEQDFDAPFSTISQQRASALIISADGFFASRRAQLVALSARVAVPTMYFQREFVDAGGLISYGTSSPDMYRQAGIYTGKILKGAKPAELPIEQPTKFELAINRKTSRALGLEIPPMLLAIADEVRMKRREFITLLGGAAAAWPLAAGAQQSATPLIGFLHAGSLAVNRHNVAAFHEGLAEAGYAEGRNVTIEFRWANNQLNQLPALAADLVGLRPAVLVAAGALRSALEAKMATSTIPIVLAGAAFDPVKEGFVASFNRPGGNVTGLTVLNTELLGKRFELLSRMVPQATRVAFLAGPSNSLMFEEETSEVRRAAQALGREIIVLEGRSDFEFETAFDTLVQRGAGALLVGVFPWLSERRHKIMTLAAHHRVPAMYPFAAFAFDGGLMSYGVGRGVFRQVGFHYVGQILKGAKPNDLPVQQPTKFELVINLKTARALGIEVPTTLLALADEVIE